VTVPLALLIAAAAAAVALTLLFVLRRLAPDDGFWGQPEPNHSGSAIGVLGGVFAILVAFVMFLALQNFIDAKRKAEAEATAVERQFHVAEAFHPGLRTRLHGRLICYARAVSFEEWPQLEHAEHSELVDDWGLESEIAVERADLGDPVEAHVLGLFDELELERAEARRDRIAAAERFVPGLLWVALIAGGTVLILYLTTFANRGTRPALQALLVGGVAMVAALNLTVIRFLDSPYSGAAGSVKPTAMEATLEEIDRELQREFAGTPIPCDGSGNPRGDVLS
jgi:hypothetical protein